MVDVEAFIARWKPSGGSERANFQQFAIELTQLLGVEAPKPATADAQADDYRFERPVTFIHTGTQSRGFIDLYRRGCFIMEAKQGTGRQAEAESQLTLLPETAPQSRQGHGVRGSRRWDDTMLRARNQADGYARAVARDDGWPPFLAIVDVGHVIELYADFSGQGQGYTQFPDGNRYRISLEDLRKEEVRTRLQAIWNNPHSLDPARISAQVTRQVAAHLAELGRSFEAKGHKSEEVARFLMRALFTMFAEDVELIPEKSFSGLLKKMRGQAENAARMLESLWTTMNTGGFSPALACDLMRFNGGLFKEATALPLDNVQLSLLIQAAEHNWREVEPAIFGTLLERALDKRQRHKLGAHYTPRAYVERLVNPTVIQPLRDEWVSVQAAALTLANQGNLTEARQVVHGFHRQLCETRVFDPACGSGNFLYVALELMKRLEGEVMALLRELGEEQGALALSGLTVDPHQFLGIEVNPWAAAVAELVLWIGYLQWHFRTHGSASPSEPVLKDFRNIENRDAVLDWDDRQPRLDAEGSAVTRWDGIGTVEHPVTGERVPDPAARTQVWDYSKPRPATWPQADFIVGNPPFIGNKRMRELLGDGYTEALRLVYPKIPESADFVMYWWEKAALSLRSGTRRFGFITTNSLRQTFNRQVLEVHLKDLKRPTSLVLAIPDHPWVDAGDGAAVRIAMTVAASGSFAGRLMTVLEEKKTENESEGLVVTFDTRSGRIHADLRTGADVAGAPPLKSNSQLAHQGVIPVGEGFRVSALTAKTMYRDEISGRILRPYLNGKQLISGSQPDFIVDFFGLTEDQARTRYPALYQIILDRVKPVRDSVNRDVHRKRWWVFAEPRAKMRPALDTIPRYIATCRTAKHRVFSFLDSAVLPDTKIIAIGSDDAAVLAVLSSKLHVTWAEAAGGWLGVGNDSNYNHAQCFVPFPFPAMDGEQQGRLAALGEKLDAHRKVRQNEHPKLTLTAIYNVLDKLRAGERLEGKDREIYDQGLVGILRDIHDRIDAEVIAAYGWPAELNEDDVLDRLVELNRTRAAEEAQGLVRWLRPDYQNPAGRSSAVAGDQAVLDVGEQRDLSAKTPWPKTLPEQIAQVRSALADLGEASPEQVARRFVRVRSSAVQPLLESLSALGHARMVAGGRYAAQLVG
ncbi:MAG: class I SAM-dependent DNA methyltransferase [Phreatobacter sp.]|nr:class I SAM-dependent DNA methyltransferase [Phreatobacter sp.]